MKKTFLIKTLRQRRAIIVLLEKGNIEIKDFGILIGALNPRQVVFELRQEGFENIIKTQRFEKTDRDGKSCRPGRYYIPQELKPIVQEFLTRDGLAAAPQTTKSQDSKRNSIHHNTERV